MYEVVEATPAHATELATSMREPDVAEVWATRHQTPLEALLAGLEHSQPHAYTALIDGRVICMFGLAPQTLTGEVGIPWLLGSELVEEHYRTFARHSRKMVQWMREMHPKLRNIVDARNTFSVRWLAWLGFTLESARPFGPDDVDFHVFHWERENV